MNQQPHEGTRKFSPSQLIIFLATVLLSAGIVPSAGILSLDLLSAMLSSAGLGWLWYHFSPIAAGLVLPLGYGVSLLYGNSPTSSLTVLLILPMGIAHILFLQGKLSRTKTVLFASICLFAISAALFSAAAIHKEGSMSVSAVKNMFQPVIDMVKQETEGMFSTEVAGTTVNLLNGEETDSLINSALTLLPGSLLGCLLVLTVFSGWVLRLLLGITHKDIPPKSAWVLADAPISAAILIASLAISSTPGSSFVQIAARNLMMPFFAYFFLVGIGRQVTVKLIDGQPTPRFTRMILLTVCLIFCFPLFFALAALFGVIDSIRSLFNKSDFKTEVQ